MSQSVSPVQARAVIGRGDGQAIVADVVVAAPTGREVRLRVDACGLCHSDLHYIEGSSGTDFPYIVGHEVAGTVESVGDEVTRWQVGDQVIIVPTLPCGTCASCSKGRPTGCATKLQQVTRPRLADSDVELTPVLGVGGLAEYVLTDEHHLAMQPEGLDVELCALLGCGVTTGFGAAVNTADILKGDAVAVIGAGGVGLASVAGAVAAGAGTVHVFDILREKLETAKEFGATATTLLDPADPPLTPEGLSGAFDTVIDAVGGAAALKRACHLAGNGGRVVIVGAPRQGERGDIDLRQSFWRRHELVVSHHGDCDPLVDFPWIASLVAEGTLPLGRYRSEVIDLDDSPNGFQRLAAGQVVRSIVRFPSA